MNDHGLEALWRARRELSPASPPGEDGHSEQAPEGEMADQLEQLIREYQEKFPDEDLPMIGLSTEELRRLLRLAIDRGRPLTEDDLPPIGPDGKR
jgi:hypothetical protein